MIVKHFNRNQQTLLTDQKNVDYRYSAIDSNIRVERNERQIAESTTISDDKDEREEREEGEPNISRPQLRGRKRPRAEREADELRREREITSGI